MHSAAFKPKPSTLYAVATPIGNLRDITLRALDVLGGVDCIAAEDTRVSGVLLAHFGIATRTIALHAHNEKQQAERVAGLLAEGKSVALITDAGTPGLSDPGAEVVAAVRRAGYAIEPIPGPSALTAALSVAGRATAPFTFNGFLPAKAGARNAALESLAGEGASQVFFEAPHRIEATIAGLAAAFGPGRRVTIARELTKRFESVHETTLGEAVAWLAEDADRRRGEFVLLVEGAVSAPHSDDAPSAADVRIFNLLRKEMSTSRAATLAADITKKPRAAFYRLAIDAEDEGAAPPDSET